MTYIAPRTGMKRKDLGGLTRGFTAIGLVRPKAEPNVGAVLRAAMCYGADLIAIQALSPHLSKFIRQPTNVTKAQRHIPVIAATEIFDVIPFDSVPIAVDLLEGATPLPEFKHPANAFYIFGPENGTLGRAITDRCRHKVYIPTASV